MSQEDSHTKSEIENPETPPPEREQTPSSDETTAQAAQEQPAPDDASAGNDPAPARGPTNKEVMEAATRIAQELGEKEKTPIWQIKKIIKLAGIEFADELLVRTHEIEANGGMMTINGERRRTPGGVYFQLARETLSESDRDQVFSKWRHALRRRLRDEARYDPFDFDQRTEILSTILSGAAGEISEMRVILTGRPGEIERRQELVITTMQYTHPGGFAMPRGVPEFPESELTYVIYIGVKHWEQVERVLKKDEADELIVEGLCAFDPELERFAIYVTHATTKKLQKKERRAQKEQEQAARGKGGDNKDKAAKDKGDKRDKKPKQAAPAAPPPEPAPMLDLNLPDGVPEEVAQKLSDLMRAADTYRRKVAALEAKPPNQQHGLDMTRRLLAGIESKIEALKREHSIEV